MVVLVVIALPPVALDSFVIMSVLLAVVGTLYLAYDLLGRQHGPLQWLTLLITCGLVSALVLGSVGSIFFLLLNQRFVLYFTLQAMVLGALMGVFTVVLVDFPKAQVKPHLVSRKGSAIGLILGLLFFLTVLFVLRSDPHQALDVPSALAMGVTCAVCASLWPYLTWNPSTTRPALFSRKGLLLGLLLTFLLWLAYFFFASHDLVFSVLASAPLAFICGGLISLWRYIHWEASNPKLHIFSRQGFQVGFVIGFIPLLMFFMIQAYPSFVKVHGTGLLDGLDYMLQILFLVSVIGAFALASAAAGSISQYMLWKANAMPLRQLGVIGLVLILLATSLQAVQPMIDLINILGT